MGTGSEDCPELRKEVKRKVTVKNKPFDSFTNDQLSCWSLARDNYRALKNVRTRMLSAGGLDVTLQFNPARIVSTGADVSKESVSRRKCFLCRDNRPEEQIKMKFEGRKGRRYDILVNPYPIFPEHLVIAMDRHCDQSIWKRYVDMLDLSRMYKGYTFMYNGPECGASAPDHHHFQALRRNILPLEKDADASLDDRVSGSGHLEYVTCVKEAELYHYRRFTRGIFFLRATTAKSMAKLFYRLLDCAPVKEGSAEPMFNLITWYTGTEYRSAVILRGAHRPSLYYSDGDDRLLLSPGCADMAGFFVVPSEKDFNRIGPDLLQEVLDEVSISAENETLVLRRLVRTQPMLSVGVMSGPEIIFEILSDGAGVRKAVYREGKIEYDGALYDELYFEEQTLSTMFAEAGFVLHGVTIGVGFHWERKETQKFAGALRIVVSCNRLLAINVIGVEDYLVSVISSEMKSTSSLELLKAHAVISRSWVMSRIEDRKAASGSRASVPSWAFSLPALVTHLDICRNSRSEDGSCGQELSGDGRRTVVIRRWYDHEDHRLFDVCADDHCQRYQGLTRASGSLVRKAVDATWGEVLGYDGHICDARFSKCCGGMTERFSTCWDDVDYPYLSPVIDAPEGKTEEDAFCNTSDESVLSQVLNDYDRETPDFFRWKVTFGVRELSSLLSRRSGVDIGMLQALVPEHRGPSGRIDRLRIIGTCNTLVVGKELEIRKILSESHLKSSAFEVIYYDSDGVQVPSSAVEKAACSDDYQKLDVCTIVLDGRGWGHGVGLCQIGAAVMASEGYGYRQILGHYYKGADVVLMYVDGICHEWRNGI